MKRSAWLIISCLLAAGCGGTGTVKGTVMYKGELLKFGSVTAVSAGGGVVQDNIKEDGTYELSGVRTGEVKFLVYCQDPKFVKVVTDLAMKKDQLPGGEGDGGGRLAAGALNTGEAAKAIQNPNLVPDKYGDEKTTTLTFKVGSGENIYNIILQP